MYSSILTAADQFSSTLVFCAWELLIKLPKPVEGGEKAAALLTPFFDEEVATRLAGEETEPEIRKKDMSSHWLKITQNIAFEFWHIPPILVLLKLTCLVTLFDRKLQVFKNTPKWTIFGILN